MVLYLTVLLFGPVSCATTRSGMPSGDTGRLMSIGENYLAAGEYGAALRYLKAAERKGKKSPNLYYDIALAYKGRGFTDRAYEYLLKALDRKKDYPEAHNALGALLAEQGRLSEAEAEFRKALEDPFYQTPHFAAFNLGHLYYRQGKYKEAKKYFQEAIDLAPNYPQAHFELGQTLEMLGDKKKAWLEYKEAVQYAPRWAEAHFHYGRLSYQFGKMVTARYSFEQVIKLAPDTEIAKAASAYLKEIEASSLKDSLKGLSGK